MMVAPFHMVAEKVIHSYNKMSEDLLNKFGLSQVSFDILMFLTNNPEFNTAQQISEVRHLKKNLVSVHVEKLVSIGLLQRHTIESDRRKIGLSCTKKSKPIVEEGLKLQKEFFKEITAGISESEWAVFDNINKKIEENAENLAAKYTKE